MNFNGKLKNKANSKSKMKDSKKDKVCFKYLKCYKEKFLRKQTLIFIICLIIFLVSFTIGMSAIDFNAPFRKDIDELANINLIQIQFIFVMILTQILALIPFVKKISIITVFYSYFMAFNVANMFYLPDCNKTLLALSVILSLLSLSLNLVLSFELSDKINCKFRELVKDKEKKIDKHRCNKNNKKISNQSKNNEENIKLELLDKEESSLKDKVAIITFVICMMLSIVNLIITKFI